MVRFFILVSAISFSLAAGAERSTLAQQIMEKYGEAVDDASRQKTTGLWRTAAAKSRAKTAEQNLDSMKATFQKVSEKISQSNQLIDTLKKEIQEGIQ
jgi:hypothetical protein